MDEGGQGRGRGRGLTRRHVAAAVPALAAAGTGAAAGAVPASAINLLDHPGGRVPSRMLPPGSDRTFVQANGAGGWFWGHASAQPFEDWYAGWTVGRARVLQDWRLVVDGVGMSRAGASVFVHDAMVTRVWPDAQVREQVELVAGANRLVVTVEAPPGRSVELVPVGLARLPAAGPGMYAARDPAAGVVRLRGWRRDGDRTTGFIFDVAGDAAGLPVIDPAADPPVFPTFSRFRQLDPFSRIHGEGLTARGLAWLQSVGGQLVARQGGVAAGQGIWAGLPWFDDFWGRDTFISFTGLLLVPGRFAEARQVLLDFAALQDTRAGSPNFGRVPNRARPDDIIYNTADGTPRLIGAIGDYLDYTGDRSIVPELWPAVRRALEGTLASWVDGDGLMVHDDADTWMDAREAGTRPFTPRGSRANDIQALWHRQLLVTARLAGMVGAGDLAADCRARAGRVAEAFNRLFVDPAGQRMADRIEPGGQPDFSMRPNQLFALDLVPEPALRTALLRRAFEALVVPWGTMSLAPDEPGFHPVHEAPGLWHKDFAYHTGTVWLWLNGIVIQRLLERGALDPAWRLFERMLREALDEGAVGCLSELRDAMPRAGAAEGRPSGTFLQAWSQAEAVRVWREWFVGLRPTGMSGRLILSPALPDAAAGWTDEARIGPSHLELAQPPHRPDRLVVTNRGSTMVVLETADGAGRAGLRRLAPGARLILPARSARARTGGDPALAGLRFVTPRPAEGFPVWQAAVARPAARE